MLLALLLCGGCASVRYGIGSQPYAPLFLYSQAARASTYQAARQVVAQWGATDLESTDLDHRVTAIINQTESTRDRILVEVHERGELMIAVDTELFDGGQWQRAQGTCASYSYGRERIFGERILLAAELPTALAIADTIHSPH
ncbi:MAG: hypothetical protein EXR72_12775 [Myxococcales bacterium]|nr:hypothetical protein [Myxococcales bacterium]